MFWLSSLNIQQELESELPLPSLDTHTPENQPMQISTKNQNLV